MSAVTASILVGTKNRVDLGIQPRWLVLLHEANGHAWHLIRLQLSGGDVAPAPRVGLPERGAPGTRPGLDSPPGILWRSPSGGDLVGELAVLLHLYTSKTPEVMAAVRRIDPLAMRRVDLSALDDRERGDLANAMRIARETDGGLYLAVTIMAGSRLSEADLLDLPGWEFNLARTVWSRDWVRVDEGRLEVTDHRVEDPGLRAPVSPEAVPSVPSSAPSVSSPRSVRSSAAVSGSGTSAAGRAKESPSEPSGQRDGSWLDDFLGP